MKLKYRGHVICVMETATRSAELIESDSGIRLPTKLTAAPEESVGDLAQRARQLVDLYLGDESSGARHPGSRAP